MFCAGKLRPNTSRQVSCPVAHFVDFLRGDVVQALWVWGWAKAAQLDLSHLDGSTRSAFGAVEPIRGQILTAKNQLMLAFCK